MGKQLMLKNILLELSQLPEAQVQRWYELILSSRENFPDQANALVNPEDTDFDWEALIEEIMNNRQEHNRERMSRVETLLND